MLYGTNEVETEAFFERFTQSKFTLKLDNSEDLPISFSLGWVEWNDKIKSVQEWLDLADEAMYHKKHRSENYLDGKK